MFKLPKDFTTNIHGGGVANSINAFSLKLGSVYWESCQYGNLKCIVTSEPERSEEVGNTKVRWKASTYDGTSISEDVDYLVTKGLEHYGPSLYTGYAYAYTQTGEDGSVAVCPWGIENLVLDQTLNVV